MDGSAGAGRRSAPPPANCSDRGGGSGAAGSGRGGGGGSRSAAPPRLATQRGAAARAGPPASRGWQRVATGAAAAAVAAAVVAASLPTSIAAACATRLWSHPEEYARCRSGTTCFFFLLENPVITLAPGYDTPDNPANPRVLFPCADYRRRGLTGFGWTLHATLFPNNTDWCALAGGPGECTFNELISLFAAAAVEAGHPASGMGLAASGAWVFTEWRATRASASDPIYEDQVTLLVKRGAASNSDRPPTVNLRALLRPFSRNTWLLVLAVLAVWMVFAAAAAARVPTPVAWRWSLRWRVLQWLYNFIRILFGGELLPAEHHFAAGRAVLIGTLIAVATVFVMFYEAALILGSIDTNLTSAVSGLSDQAMCSWTVLRGAATEDIFVGMVNAHRGDAAAHASVARRTWSTCETVEECIRQVETGAAVTAPACAAGPARRTEMFLSWRTTALAAFRANPRLCNALQVVDAEELFFFSVGWQFANVNVTAAGAPEHVAALAARRAAINARFRRARLERTTEELVERGVRGALPCGGTPQQVSVELLVLPVMVVLAVGLLLAGTVAAAVPRLHRALTVRITRQLRRQRQRRRRRQREAAAAAGGGGLAVGGEEGEAGLMGDAAGGQPGVG